MPVGEGGLRWILGARVHNEKTTISMTFTSILVAPSIGEEFIYLSDFGNLTSSKLPNTATTLQSKNGPFISLDFTRL